jgi:exopolysaccharide production protein ExoQ
MNIVANEAIPAYESAASARSESGLAFAAGFVFSARTAVTFVLVRALGADPQVGAAAALLFDVLLLGLGLFSAVGPQQDLTTVSRRAIGSIARLSTVRWVFVFLALSGVSLAWSATVSLPVSAAYWFGIAADVAIVLLLLRTASVTAVSHSLMRGFVWSTCALALLAWLLPAQADLRLGDEEYFNTNQIGNLCAFAIFLAQILMRRKDGKWGLAVAFLSITLLRSLSKTTIAAFVLSQGLLVILDKSIKRKTKVWLVVAVLGIIVVFWGLFAAYYDVYTNAGNQAETFTGRTGIWAYALDHGFEQPWIGHGFDSLWKVAPPFGSDLFEARHAENEILQQFYAYGVVGVALLGAVYISLFRRVRKLPRGPLRIILISLIVFIVIRGLAEAEPFDLLLPLWSIVMISMLVENERNLALPIPAAL